MADEDRRVPTNGINDEAPPGADPYTSYDDFNLPAYVGLPSFQKLPWVTDADALAREKPDVAIVGAPYDDSVSHRPGARFGPRAIRQAVLHTLGNICQGGIYDHLGGGFARYSVDALWLVPHFEKMLYDNAQLLALLSDAAADTDNALFAARAAETVGRRVGGQVVGSGIGHGGRGWSPGHCALPLCSNRAFAPRIRRPWHSRPPSSKPASRSPTWTAASTPTMR